MCGVFSIGLYAFSLFGCNEKTFLFLKEGPRLRKLSSRHINQISGRLEELKRQFPSEMTRQPRGLMTLRDSKLLSFECFRFIQGFLH